MSFATIAAILGSDVATSGTFAVSYPSGCDRGDFVNGKYHKLLVNQRLYVAPTDFTIALGDTTATITWLGATTLKAGAQVRVQLDRPGVELVDGIHNTSILTPVRIELGNPLAASATGISSAQTLGSATNFTLDGARVASGVATLDVPRNVTLTCATTDHSGKTITVYGTDEYGKALVESRAGPNANTVQLKKAFKTVTRVASSAAIATNGISVGFGDVLGLPVWVPGIVSVIGEEEDGASATAGALVAGLSPLTPSTATTADVRGTYDPSSACNGTKAFALLAALADPTFVGVPQYTA